ncbi:hypothetical protein VYU27_010037, partial [Nannochloropsis oceanica]
MWDAVLPENKTIRRARWGGLMRSASTSSPSVSLGGARLPPSPSSALALSRSSSSSSMGNQSTGKGGNSLVTWAHSSSRSLLNHSARDAMGGLSGGMTSVVGGFGLGLASLVAAPTIGAQQYGVKGFLAGLGAGLAGCVVLPVAGVVGGVSYIIGGVVNTPTSVLQMSRGRVWDSLLQKWV